MQQLVHAIEKNEDSFHFDPREEPATVAGVLKLYLRQLPLPLFPWPAAEYISLLPARLETLANQSELPAECCSRQRTEKVRRRICTRSQNASGGSRPHTRPH